MHNRPSKEDPMNQQKYYMEQPDYGWGTQMYGGAFSNQEFSPPGQFYGSQPPKEPMQMEGQGSNMFYQNNQGADWEYQEPKKPNYNQGYGQKMYMPGKILDKKDRRSRC